MLKLGKTSWIILSAGLFVVIIAGLGFARSQQIQEQGQLGEELSIAEKRLNKLQLQQRHEQQEELQIQLDNEVIKLVEAKDRLHQSVESIDVTDEFFVIAQSCNVTVMSTSSSSIKSEKLEGVSCAMITFNAVVEGEVPSIISFVIKLNNDFTTGVVESARISIPEPDAEDKPSASIMMVAYAYEGD